MSHSNKDYVMALYHQQSVEELFDDYAATFEKHLREHLQYNVPEMLYGLWKTQVLNQQEINGNDIDRIPVQRCLDLGCGTGLAGVAFKPHCQYIEGVDLSANMCREAQKKTGVYNRVVKDTLLNHMKKQTPESFDLIVSADVFMYVLDLNLVLAQIHRILSLGGYLLFSTETLGPNEGGDEDVFLKRRETERFAHKTHYVLQTAALSGDSREAATTTMKLVSLQSNVILRMDDDLPVIGDLFLFCKIAE